MSSVQNDAQFTPVHLVYQFTKLAGQPLTKARGFPAPYHVVLLRVPRQSPHDLQRVTDAR